MKKQMCLAALCLLVAAGGCAQTPDSAPGGNTGETAREAAAPAAEGNLYRLSAETPQGVYNVDGGRGQYFLDYSAAENRPLCAVPGCTHTGEGCAARLPEGTYGLFLYPLTDGSLVYSLQDDASYSFWWMDGDGGNRQELARMAEENTTWNFLCADEAYLYLYDVTYGEEGEQFTVSRLPLTGGTPETLWGKTEYTAPELLGVNGRELVLLWYDWSERETVPPADTTEDMPWEEIRERMAAYDAEMAKVTGKFRVTRCSVDTGEEQVVDAWTSNYGSAGRTLYWELDRLYWFDCEEPGPLHWVTADGQTGELAVDWPQEVTQWQGDLYINLECRILLDKMLLTVCETQGTDPVVSRYALDLETGTLQEIPLQYVANATQQPVSIEGQGENCLAVIFEEQVQMGTYLDTDGMPATSMETHRRYGLISTEDFLAGIPNYREIQMDME